MPELEKNIFYDLNQLPEDEGMLLFGISLSRIANAQSAESCFEYFKHLDTKIKKTKGIGGIFWYGDYLYFLSEDSAKDLRSRFLAQMTNHKNGFVKIIKKHVEWIPKAFSFITFGQLIVDNSDIFEISYRKILEIYKKDKFFQQCVLDDCKNASRDISEEQQTFFLEEITALYLASKGKLILKNDYINGHEKWILHCYPGKPLKSETYLYQLNPLKLHNKKNKYENCYYDLAGKKLYDFNRIDLETFDFSD